MDWWTVLVSAALGAAGGAISGMLVVRYQRGLARRGRILVETSAFRARGFIKGSLGDEPAFADIADYIRCVFDVRIRNEKEVEVELRDLRLGLFDGRTRLTEVALTGSGGGTDTWVRPGQALNLLAIGPEKTVDIEAAGHVPGGNDSAFIEADRIEFLATYGRNRTLRAVVTRRPFQPFEPST